jgi:hypothetical protein
MHCLPYVGKKQFHLFSYQWGSLAICRKLGRLLTALDIPSEVGNNHDGGETSNPRRCSVTVRSPTVTSILWQSHHARLPNQLELGEAIEPRGRKVRRRCHHEP